MPRKTEDLNPAHNLRAELLETAKGIVAERNASYGDPTMDFKRIANLWTALFTEQGYVFKPWHVALMMGLLKDSRLMNTHDHADSWVDKAGYAACGFEVSQLVPDYHV